MIRRLLPVIVVAVLAVAVYVAGGWQWLDDRLIALRMHVAMRAPTATMVIARYDPDTAILCWAQAGHPAPLRSRDGATSALPRPAGPLLGAIHEARYDTADIRLVPGDLLLFYTDGLIEHRHRSLLEGLSPVISTLNRITGSPRAQPLAELLAGLHQANPDDDTCLLAARPLHPAAVKGN